MNDKMSKIQTKLQKLADERQRQKEQIALRVDGCKEAIAAAEKKMQMATENDDLKSFSAAKAVKSDNADALEMYQRQYDALTASPVISDSDADKLVDKLAEIRREGEKAAAQTAFDLWNKVIAAADELRNLYNSSNDITAKLRDLCGDANKGDWCFSCPVIGFSEWLQRNPAIPNYYYELFPEKRRGE